MPEVSPALSNLGGLSVFPKACSAEKNKTRATVAEDVMQKCLVGFRRRTCLDSAKSLDGIVDLLGRSAIYTFHDVDFPSGVMEPFTTLPDRIWLFRGSSVLLFHQFAFKRGNSLPTLPKKSLEVGNWHPFVTVSVTKTTWVFVGA